MEDAEFLSRFEGVRLPFEQWTHRAHVKVAYLYLRRHPFEEALDRMRLGIRAFNAVHRVEEGPTSATTRPLRLRSCA